MLTSTFYTGFIAVVDLAVSEFRMTKGEIKLHRLFRFGLVIDLMT